MTADVVISGEPNGLMEIELVKNGRLLKSIRLMHEEWDNLVGQITNKELQPIDVLMAKYQRIHNSGANCIPISNLLESIRDAKKDPKGMMERENLEKWMMIK